MNRYPFDLIGQAKAPDIKKAICLVVPPVHPNDCENCGGTGKMFVFLATVGPLRNSPGLGLSGKWFEDSWWGGSTVEGTCPVCDGSGRKTPGAMMNFEDNEERFERSRMPYKDE